MIFKIWLFMKDLYGSWHRIWFHLGKLHVKDFRFFSNLCLYTCFFNCPSAHLFLCLYIDSPKFFDIEYSTDVNIEKNFAFFLIHHPQAPSPLQVRVRCTAFDWDHWVGRLCYEFKRPLMIWCPRKSLRRWPLGIWADSCPCRGLYFKAQQ